MSDISTSVIRADAGPKSSGAEKYVADISYPDMLHAKTIRSEKARARLVSVEYPQFPDGYFIFDHRHVPGQNIVKMLVDDWPVFAVKEVNYIGDPIALVLGPDREIIDQICKETNITYEEKPGIYDIDDALKNRGDPIFGKDNIFAAYEIKQGETEKAFSQAVTLLEETYATGYQEHIYMEPQGMVGAIEDGIIVIRGSIQCPYYVKNALVLALGCAENEVEVIGATTGGGFGGKEEYPSLIAAHVAIAVSLTGKPVSLIFNREEDISFTTKRHPSRITIKMAVDKNNNVSALKADIELDGGAYAGLSAVVLQRAMFAAAGVYRIPNIHLSGRVVATNNVPSGAFRGFGAPQALFAVELHMEHLAKHLGVDVKSFKEAHFVAQGDNTVTAGTFRYPVPLQPIMERLQSMVESDTIENGKKGSKRKTGFGTAYFLHGCGFTGSGERDIIRGTVKLVRYPDDRVELLLASMEIGQGAQTTLRKIVSHTLEIPLTQIIYENPNTARVPDSGPTVASRTAMVVGGLVKAAADELKERWSETGTIEAVSHYRQPPEIEWDQENLQGDAYPDYSWGGVTVEVAVDTTTYEIEVTGIWSVFDVGHALDERIIGGQVDGGIAQGLGWASIEVMDTKKGSIRQKNMTDYIIPSALEYPRIKHQLIDNPYPWGPYGAKGAGELTFVGAAPAFAAAVENALQIKVNKIPVTPEHLFEVLENE